MKVRKLIAGLVAVISLTLGVAQQAAAQSERLRPDPLSARFGHESRRMLPSPNAAVVTQSGPVKGFQFAGAEQPVNNEEVFPGIPYATPPLGDLRWMPPQPPGKFHGLFRANNFGNFCTQPDGFGGTFGAEDCLTVNVFRPLREKGHKNTGLPVMVWIHGGGLVTGGSFIYDPSPLVLGGDVIVVTINYRLGFLGFFAQSAIDAEGHLNGNYGFMDQQAALQWVQHNIGLFGGDRNRVTIFGESAGGQSVYANLASPTAAGLFQGAIAESGAYVEFQDYFNFIVPLATGESAGTSLVQSGAAIADSVGCSSQTAACLRAVPASTLALQEPGTIYPFVDGTILTQTMTAAFASGQFNQVPVISGGNHDEWRAFIPNLTDVEYPAAVASLVGAPETSLFVQFLVNVLYPLSNYPPPNSAPFALGALGTDFIFACPERNSLRSLSQFVTTHAYEFNDENAPNLFSNPGFPEGAYHFAEVQYLFDLNQRFAGFNPFTPDQQALSNTMIGYWTQFATTGDPNSASAPVWSPYSSAVDQFQSLAPLTLAPESGFDADHNCSSFWNTF
jgi:para-nitrobenzyl esterase